ncbi:hypothetical protein [Flavobacterium sp.]|uniref:hypothetical protein n=1 Tax=Flavobacterium sp. TaxID=239 RepID=UPI0031DCBC83
MKKQKIEDIFSSMEDFSSVPPPELWGQIEEKLDKPKKKKRAILWWSAAACLLLGLLLPSVLHFTSNGSGVNSIQNGSVENNVVLDQKNNDTDKTRSIENNQNILEKESNNNRVSSSEKTTNQSQNNQLKQNSETSKTQSDSQNKRNNINFGSEINEPKNNAVAEKTFVPANENGFNAVSKNQISTNRKENINQAGAEKTFVSAGENGFNAASQNQLLATKKENSNKAVAEKSFAPNKSNSFNYGTKSNLSDIERKNADKILAEKKFTPAKTNTFIASSGNQLPNSVFEDLSGSKNKSAIAYTNSNPNAKRNPNALSPSNKEKENIQKTTADRSIASLQNNNSKNNAAFVNGNVLSKKDSVQLAELQNLEKGIAAAPEEEKKKKEDKLLSKADKWALQLFAGVASSENYKNNKTLGNVNDSKQSNSYGVKTQYKINKKWAVASGFKINELGQSVANVSYLNAKKQALFTSSDYFVKNETLPQIASNANNYVLVSNSTKDVLKSDNVETGNLDQNLRYIEMPLEVSYSIFNKKRTNINLNTGGFVGKLISNTVAIDGNSMGENVNANNYVYGTTLSSTVQYRVYKKTNVFVEPAVNYYANPLTNQSFNQFQWGLNFGLNVNF